MKHFAFLMITSLATVGLAEADSHLVDYTLQLRTIEQSNDELPIDSDQLYQLSGTVSTPLSAGDDQFRLSLPHSGLSYFARFRLSNTVNSNVLNAADEGIDDDTELVSGLYQIGYGGQSKSWFGGVNLSVEKFDHERDGAENDTWALGFYAGSRLALTGLGSDAPLWTLSLVGEYERELFDDASTHEWSGRGKWYITPGVYWVADTFSLKAGVQVPLDDERHYFSSEEPDYRLRADFEHRF